MHANLRHVNNSRIRLLIPRAAAQQPQHSKANIQKRRRREEIKRPKKKEKKRKTAAHAEERRRRRKRRGRERGRKGFFGLKPILALPKILVVPKSNLDKFWHYQIKCY